MAPFGPWPGESSGSKFLVDIYNNGLIDPLTDNVFEYASGNKRFIGGVGGVVLPDSGFFESSTTPGNLSVATDYFSRYYPLGAHVGGTNYDEYSAYDPNWNGTFRGMDGIQHIANRATFTNGSYPQYRPTPGLIVGQTSFCNVFGFFDGTDYWPLLDSNDGAREDFRIDLYNEFYGAQDERGRLTGWGTWINRPIILQHGITAALDIQAQFHIAGGTGAGDGIGIFFRNNTDDPPYGIMAWYWVGDGAAGFEFYGRETDGTLLDMLQMDPSGGAVFNIPVTAPAPLTFANGAISKVSFRSAPTDLTVGTTVNIPIANPGDGKLFYVTALNIEIGTPTGGPGTTTAILDLHVNGAVWQAGYGSLTVATLTSTGPANQFILSLVENGPILDPTQALDVVIAAPMGGYTSVPCRFTVDGFYA
jgi:hypothetical protein